MLKNLAVLCLMMVLSQGVNAEKLTVVVAEPNGQPIRNSVVVLTASTPSPQPQSEVVKEASMDQVNKQFVPHVLAIQTNTVVTFPNSDSIKHHVYSFSPTKSFEIRLYKALDASPIQFDKAGVVDIGCNIHDWMLGYIYITDSPYFAKTDADGKAKIDAPAGKYTLSVWHPRLDPNKTQPDTPLDIKNDMVLPLTLAHDLLPSFDYGEGFEDY